MIQMIRESANVSLNVVVPVEAHHILIEHSLELLFMEDQ
jgi:hypothetical protein